MRGAFGAEEFHGILICDKFNATNLEQILMFDSSTWKFFSLLAHCYACPLFRQLELKRNRNLASTNLIKGQTDRRNISILHGACVLSIGVGSLATISCPTLDPPNLRSGR